MELPVKVAWLAFFLAFLVQILYWFLIYSRLIFYKSAGSKSSKKPVSVIICARNEEENLRKNLPLILNQEYPDFEVIVINDCSTDGTQDYLNDLKEQYSFLKITTIKEDIKFKHGKKLAVTIGIKAASHDLLLFTDADCHPESNLWISRMASGFNPETSLVLGYGGYLSEKGLLNLAIRFETLYIAIQYLSYALAGIPYMGVGRNLAYRKSMFFDNKGFAQHSHLVSGDDDLFVNEVANRYNTRIEISPESHTRSEPCKTWKEWYFQKRRHLTTGPDYKFMTKFLLSLEVMSRLVFYAGLIYLIITATSEWIAIIVPFIIRLGIWTTVFKIMGRRLNEKHLLLPSFLFDILLPLYNIFILFSNYVEARKNRWK